MRESATRRLEGFTENWVKIFTTRRYAEMSRSIGIELLIQNCSVVTWVSLFRNEISKHPAKKSNNENHK